MLILIVTTMAYGFVSLHQIMPEHTNARCIAMSNFLKIKLFIHQNTSCKIDTIFDGTMMRENRVSLK